MKPTNNPLFRPTRHAALRSRQRGIRKEDLQLIVMYGTPTLEGFLLRTEDALSAIQEIKYELELLEKAA